MKTYPMKARIRNDGSGPARIDIFDDVGDGGFFGGGISAQDFAAQLAAVRGPLEVHVNSYGGDVFAGQTMAEAIRNYPGPVTTKIDGIAASIASVIVQAGREREAAAGALLFLHDAWSFAEGNAADMRAEAEVLDKVSNVLAGEYARRAGGTAEQWRAVMQATKWYDAQEALDARLIDKISDSAAQRPASVDVDQMAARAPGRIMAALRSMPRALAGDDGDDSGDSGDGAVQGAKCRTCNGKGRLKHPATGKPGVKCPSCGGSGRYDPDGDGDDDSTAGGDTDHDYVLPDGSPGPKALTEARVREILREEVAAAAARLPVLAAADDSPWDGGKAMANGAASDDPAAFYKGICAGRREGDPKLQESWALPYRYHPGDAPNAKGTANALARLPQTQGLVNAAEAKKTLQAAMKQVNPDYEPEDSGDKSVFSRRLEQMRGAMPPLRGEGA